VAASLRQAAASSRHSVASFDRSVASPDHWFAASHRSGAWSQRVIASCAWGCLILQSRCAVARARHRLATMHAIDSVHPSPRRRQSRSDRLNGRLDSVPRLSLQPLDGRAPRRSPALSAAPRANRRRPDATSAHDALVLLLCCPLLSKSPRRRKCSHRMLKFVTMAPNLTRA
jgi:hypothetical protein